MKIEAMLTDHTKDKFSLIVHFKSNELKFLLHQAYKDEVSVQELLQHWMSDSLNDLVTFCKEN